MGQADTSRMLESESMVRTWTVALVAFLALGAVSLRAQGVELKAKGAMVFCGSESNCTKPATIRYVKVRDATPEWQEIQADGVRKGSARYTLLMARMGRRIKAACDVAAGDAGHDLVVNQGDISDPRGLDVADITDQVIDELESVGFTP